MTKRLVKNASVFECCNTATKVLYYRGLHLIQLVAVSDSNSHVITQFHTHRSHAQYQK